MRYLSLHLLPRHRPRRHNLRRFPAHRRGRGGATRMEEGQRCQRLPGLRSVDREDQGLQPYNLWGVWDTYLLGVFNGFCGIRRLLRAHG